MFQQVDNVFWLLLCAFRHRAVVHHCLHYHVIEHERLARRGQTRLMVITFCLKNTPRKQCFKMPAVLQHFHGIAVEMGNQVQQRDVVLLVIQRKQNGNEQCLLQRYLEISGNGPEFRFRFFQKGIVQLAILRLLKHTSHASQHTGFQILFHIIIISSSTKVGERYDKA